MSLKFRALQQAYLFSKHLPQVSIIKNISKARVDYHICSPMMLILAYVLQKWSVQSIRHLNLLEYQSKSLLEKHNVAVQKFIVADNISDANELRSKLSKFLINL